MSKLLFIGTFLSHKQGTKSISERLYENLSCEFDIILVSKKENKILRILEIIHSILFFSYEKIHIDVFSGTSFNIVRISVFFAFFVQKPVILTLRGGNLPSFTNSNFELVKKIFRRVEVIQTPSLYLKTYFETKGFNLSYLPNFIDSSKFPFKPSQKGKSLLWVRAFDKTYNPEIAVKVLIELIKTYPDITLTMVGPDKGELNRVVELIKSNNLGHHVKITGKVDNSKLYEYYHNHSIYLNTTSFESFGNSVLEAASCGIPIVSNSVGEIKFLWTNRFDMMLVNDNHIKDYVDNIKDLFENKKLYDFVVKNAKKKSLDFSWQKIKSKWINLLS
jgi:glycosyltransferase involved in cell wall biosynthesis